MKLPDPATPLDSEAAAAAFEAVMTGALSDNEIARFLSGLADRGETPQEIAAAAGVMRRYMRPIAAPAGAIDLCGTGGDGSNSLNISTAAAFVVAACGVPVAKHGNRAASSNSGASDVLEVLGWKADLSFERLEACLADVGLVFLHAPNHHPAMKHVAAVRRQLGRRTIFNILGPLANPAGVRRQMLGVFSSAWVPILAQALAELGAEKALVLHGSGMDELAVHGTSELAWVEAGSIRRMELDPKTLGIPAHQLSALAGEGPEGNARAMRRLFAGERGDPAVEAYRDVVALNAAGALMVADSVSDLAQGLTRARDALSGGAAADLLARFLAFR